MHNNEKNTYPLMTLRPCFRYIILTHLFFVPLILVLAGMDDPSSTNRILGFYTIAFMCGVGAIVSILSLLMTSYTITSEQIIIKKGLMARTTHYIELYRVVDYEQQQNLLQLLFGIKTVFILSRDRTNGCLKMVGIKASKDVVGEIRRRVEYNQKRKGIYEINS